MMETTDSRREQLREYLDQEPDILLDDMDPDSRQKASHGENMPWTQMIRDFARRQIESDTKGPVEVSRMRDVDDMETILESAVLKHQDMLIDTVLMTERRRDPMDRVIDEMDSNGTSPLERVCSISTQPHYDDPIGEGLFQDPTTGHIKAMSTRHFDVTIRCRPPAERAKHMLSNGRPQTFYLKSVKANLTRQWQESARQTRDAVYMERIEPDVNLASEMAKALPGTRNRVQRSEMTCAANPALTSPIRFNRIQAKSYDGTRAYDVIEMGLKDQANLQLMFELGGNGVPNRHPDVAIVLYDNGIAYDKVRVTDDETAMTRLASAAPATTREDMRTLVRSLMQNSAIDNATIKTMSAIAPVRAHDDVMSENEKQPPEWNPRTPPDDDGPRIDRTPFKV